MKFKYILAVDDEPDLLELYNDLLSSWGYQVDTCADAFAAEKKLHSKTYDLVISDIKMPGKSGIQMLHGLRESKASIPPFIFISGHRDPDIIEQANRLGTTEVLEKPIDQKKLRQAVDDMERRAANMVDEVMSLMRSIGGLTLGESKRQLVSTRLNRRSAQLGMQSIDDYFEYFKQNREKELKEIVSHITTHHTYFFREKDHFTHLEQKVFPQAVQANKSIRIWSAATSTGEEPYSIGICYLEYLRSKGIQPADAPKLEILCTDIDEKSLAHAKRGIYERERIKDLPADLVSRYFDIGKGELSGFYRVKDSVHKMCQFSRWNLQSDIPPHRECDAIFVRNVLIYFQPIDIEKICKKLATCLKKGGYLVLGHSESLQGLETTLQSLGRSIYMNGQNAKVESAPVKSIQEIARKSKVKVFIIDDSATVRTMIRQIVKSDPLLEVVGEAVNPVEAQAGLASTKPDVITLDIHMPVMDGITYLRQIRGSDHPQVIMISSVSLEDATNAMQCFELGAYDYIEKPEASSLAVVGDTIRQSIREAAISRPVRQTFAQNKTRGKVETAAYESESMASDLIAIGASTGGVEALRVVLEQMPAVTPPILIVQHIPPSFSKAFADRLSTLCRIKVSEATDGQMVEPSHAYIAPGGKQLGVTRVGNKLRLVVNDDAPVNRFKPSVDYLFESLCRVTDHFHISAAILTGMGSDGAKGLQQLKGLGVHTIAQDQESCVVFGMPKVAIELGAAIEILPLPSIAYHLLKSFKTKRAA